MRRPVIIGGSPFIVDVYKKSAKALFDETGGNSGNLAFQYAVASHMPGNVPIMSWGTSAAQVRAAGDIIVLPLANQLGRHTDLGSAASRLEEFGLPVIGLGLGAQTDKTSQDIELSEGTLRWLQVIAKFSPSDAPNIGVRGPYTQKQIERLGLPNSAVVTGCPSNFINTADIADQVAAGFSRKPRHIAVMAGIPYTPHLARIEQDLASIVTLSGGSYIVQHGLEMLRLARGEFEDMGSQTLELCRSYIAPHLHMEEFKTWCRRYTSAFYDARAWMDYVRRFDFVVGTRFHGAMLSIQAGVPAGCITHDSRTQEMCETMGIPNVHYSAISGGITASNVRDLFSFNADQYRQTRGILLKQYIDLLRNAEIVVPSKLEKLVERA